MLKSVIFDKTYSEASVRSLAKAFEKFPSVKVQQISIVFATHPDIRFEFNGEHIDHLIQQANATEKALKEAAGA